MLATHKAIRLGSWMVVLGLSAGLAGSFGCSGAASAPPVKYAQIQAGDMPEGGEWNGVYYSPVYGYLHLVKDKNNVEGKWRTASGSAWGELHGQVTGDVLRYTWTEHKIGFVGPSAEKSGHGYFQYLRAADENSNDNLKGEWGLGQSEAGNDWTALKQRNMNPEPESVVPDQNERVRAGGWDGSD